MTRFSKILKDGLFFGAFLILASMIIAKIDIDDETRIAGPFFAIDGDTLAAGAERLRLVGIDAPEADQTCGRDGAWSCGDTAREALAALVKAGQAECAGNARDRYGRVLVRCRADGVDINAAMVRQGMAVASGDYVGEEAAAKAERTGIWAGDFETPRAFRASRGLEVEQEGGEGGSFLDRLKGLFS